MRIQCRWFGGEIDALEWGSRVLLALVFIFAGVPKLLDVKQFAEVIGAYGLLPYMFLLPTALLLSLMEIVAAVGVVFRRKWAIFLMTGLFVVFIAVLCYGIAMGLDIDCGCFGPEDPEREAFHGLRTALARDLLFLIPLGYLFFKTYFYQRSWRKES